MKDMEKLRFWERRLWCAEEELRCTKNVFEELLVENNCFIKDGKIAKDSNVWAVDYEITYNDRYVGEHGWIYNTYNGKVAIDDNENLQTALAVAEIIFKEDEDCNYHERFLSLLNEIFESINPTYSEDVIYDYDIEIDDKEAISIYMRAKTQDDWNSISDFSARIKQIKTSELYKEEGGNNDF